MDKNSFTYKALKNITYRFTAYLWPMLFNILITPFIVLQLGVKEYGIYIFIITITSLFSLLDFGLSSAITKYLAEYSAQKDEHRMKNLIYSANSLFLLVGLTGLAITLILILGGHYFFPARFANNSSYYTLLFVLAAINFFVSSINNVYSLIPDALQRFDISSKLNIVWLTISPLANLIIVFLGYKLLVIFTVQAILQILFILARRYYALKLLPLAEYRLAWVKEEVRKCLSYGFAMVINNTANTLLFSLDRLIIPIFAGTAQLTYYSLPGNIAARIPGVTDNLSGIILPVSSGLQGTSEKERIKRFYIRSVRLIAVIASAISLSVIFLSYQILRFWLNLDFANQSTKILIILTVTNFIIALLSPITNFFFGLGKVKFSSILSVAMAIINVICLFIFVPKYGITGAAWAYLISVLPIFYMIYFIEQKYLNLEKRLSYHFQMFLKLGATGLVFYFITKFLITPLITNMGTLMVLGPSAVLVYIILYYILGFFEKEDADDLKKLWKQSFKS